MSAKSVANRCFQHEERRKHMRPHKGKQEGPVNMWYRVLHVLNHLDIEGDGEVLHSCRL